MLIKMILKVSLKALLPVAAMLGMAAYSIHLKGGDPAAMARSIGGRMQSQASATFNSATQAASNTLGGSLDGLSSAADGKGAVYRWTDAAGVTHFSTERPAGDAERILLDPDRNMIVGVKISAPPSVESPQAILPGMAGITLPGRSPEEVLSQIE